MKHIIMSAALALCCIFAPGPVSQTVVEEIARTGMRLGEYPNLVRGKRVLTIVDADSAHKDRWDALRDRDPIDADVYSLLTEILSGTTVRFNRGTYKIPENTEGDTTHRGIWFCAQALEDPKDVKTIAATWLETE